MAISHKLKALRNPKTRADIAASLSWSLVVGSSVELLAAGLTWQETLYSRGLNLTIAGVWGGPAGKVRDYFWERTGTTERSHWARRAAVDGIAYTVGWLPTYAAAVYAAGARGEKLEDAIKSCVVGLMLMSIPYNWWMDRLRHWMAPQHADGRPGAPRVERGTQCSSAELPAARAYHRADPLERLVRQYAPEAIE